MEQINDIYKQDEELARLNLQSRLLKDYEQPMYEFVFSGKNHAFVLDIGSNNGSKTVERFGREEVSQVIGIEYHEELVREANRRYQDERFRFCHVDVESDQFETVLADWMRENGVEAFDIVNLSFILLHLKQPGVLLARLRQFLKPDGMLVIVEPDDRECRMIPDEHEFMKRYMKACAQDPVSGNRHSGGQVLELLTCCGYQNIVIHSKFLSLKDADRRKRELMFEMYFSYLASEYEKLCALEPDNVDYAENKQMVDETYPFFQQEYVERAENVTCGIYLMTCSL